MAKGSSKQSKAVKKIGKAIRKAVDKGVSAELVSEAVREALTNPAGDVDAEPAAAPQTKAQASKIPGRNKVGDVTLKRGLIADNKKPMLPDVSERSPKKLPGKRKPSTSASKKTST